MTEQEFRDLEIGDVVYYYNNINLNKISTISAALKRKVVGKIFEKDGVRRIAFEGHGVILESLLWMFDTNRDKLLYTKLSDIRKKLKDVNNKSNYPHGLKERYVQLLQQKNIQPMLEKYPELLI